LRYYVEQFPCNVSDFLELRDWSAFLFSTVPIFDKMQEGKGAKFINFGNQVFRRPVQSDLTQFCVASREAAKGDTPRMFS
jgi:hypothetical protein